MSDITTDFTKGEVEETLEENLIKIDKALKKTIEFEEDLSSCDYDFVNFSFNQLIEQIDVNNVDCQLFVNKLHELYNSNQLIITTCNGHDAGGYYSPEYRYVAVRPEKVKLEGPSVLAHELGHFLHYHALNGKIPDNFDLILSNAAKQAVDNGKLKKLINEYDKLHLRAYKQAQKEINVPLKQKFLGFIFDSSVDRMRKWNRDAGRVNEIIRKQHEFSLRLADLIDAIYKGKAPKNIDFDYLTERHRADYYSRKSPFVEIIANFTALKVTGKEHDLQLLKNVFGEEFYNMLDTTFQKMVEPSVIQKEQPFEQEKKLKILKYYPSKKQIMMLFIGRKMMFY